MTVINVGEVIGGEHYGVKDENSGSIVVTEATPACLVVVQYCTCQ